MRFSKQLLLVNLLQWKFGACLFLRRSHVGRVVADLIESRELATQEVVDQGWEVRCGRG